MARVKVQFDGVSSGAKKAAAETRAAIKSVGDEGDKQSHRIRSAFGSALALGAKAGVGGVVALGGAVAWTGFKFDDLKQKATIAFTTMLGSGEKAQSFLNDLAKFAAKTPFNFGGLVESSQRLLAMGFTAKQIIPTMTAVGDAVSALGGSPEKMDRVITALGQIKAKGKASAEEMLQLTEAGIPAWQMLADKIGKSVPEAMKLVTKGAISSDVAIAAVTTGMEKRFGGMMEKQSHTFSGLLSNLQDTFQQVSGKVMQPFFEMATKGMQWLVDYTSRPEFTAGVERFAAALRDNVGRAVAWLRAWFVKHWADIKSAISFAWDAVKLGARVFQDVMAASDKAAHAVGGWKPFLTALAGGFVALKAVMLGFMVVTRIQAMITAKTIQAALISTGIGAVVVALGIAVGLIIAHWDTVKKAVVKVAEAIADKFRLVFNWLVRQALQVALNVVEPFSHLPGKLGGWARDAKDAMQAELDKFRDGAQKSGASAGDAYGAAFYKGALAWVGAAKVNTGPGGGGDFPGASGPGKTGTITAGLGALEGELGKYGVKVIEDFATTGHAGQPGGKKGGHSLHGSGQAADLAVNAQVWAALLARAGAFAELYGPWGLYHYGVKFHDAGLQADHMDHIHVSYTGGPEAISRIFGESPSKPSKAKATPTAMPTPTDATYGVTAADLTGAGDPTKGKKATGLADATDKAQALNAARWIAAHADKVLSPELEAKIQRRADALTVALTHVVKAKDLSRLRKQLTDLVNVYESSVSLGGATILARKGAAAIAAHLERMPDDVRANLKPKLEKLQADLGDVTSKGALDRIKKGLTAIQKALEEATKKMEETVRRRRDAFAAAYGMVADKALQVFDAKTAELLRRARVTGGRFGGLGEGDLTAEEKALAAFEAEQAAAAKAKDRADAGAIEDPVERAARMRELDLQDQRETLQSAAELSRKAADEALDLERKRIQDERDLLRERLQGRLGEIKQAFADEEITATEAQSRLLAALADPQYQTDFNEAGALVGEMFARGFTDALGAITDAIRVLSEAVNALSKASGSSFGAPEINTALLPARGFGRPHTITGGFARGGKIPGGKIPGRYVGRDDTIMAPVTQGETVIDRRLTEALEDVFVRGNGGRGGGVGDVYLDGQKVGQVIAQDVKSEQSRLIGYRSQRA